MNKPYACSNTTRSSRCSCREASCSLGQRLAEELRPSTDPDRVLAALAVTTEARRAWEEAGRLPLGGLHDVAAEVERARIGGVLAPEDLLRVGSTLTGGRRLREFLAERRERLPMLWADRPGARFVPADRGRDRPVPGSGRHGPG